MSKLVSPNDMLEGAKQAYLEGKDPVSREDWAYVLNFVAFNVADGLEDTLCKLFLKMYDIPLSEAYASEIAAYQVMQKALAKAQQRAKRDTDTGGACS